MDLTPEQMMAGCKWCGGDDYWEGPSGGLSVNVECQHCGAGYNWHGRFGADILHGPTKAFCRQPPPAPPRRPWWRFWR